MKKKGFTLIEILAVFAVLIVIFLITYPVIKKIVYESDKRAFLDEAYNVLDSYNYYYLDNQDDPNVYEEVNVKDLPLTNNKLEGFVYYDAQPYVYELTNGSFCVHYGTKESLNINDIVDGNCNEDEIQKNVNPEYIPDIEILDIGTNSIKFEIVSGEDTISNHYCISSYEDNESCSDKTNFITSDNIVLLNNLEENKAYSIFAYVNNQDKDSNIERLDITTLSTNPSISCVIDNLGWASKKKVTCTYPKSEAYIDSYKINDEGFVSASKIQEIEVYENSIITAYSFNSILDLENEESEYEEITKEVIVDKIDYTNPVINSISLDNSIIQSENRKVTIHTSDLESGIKGYAIVNYIDEEVTNINTVSSDTFDIYMQNGSYILYVFDNAGNKSEPESIVVTNVISNRPSNAKLEVLNVSDDSITVLMQGQDDIGIKNYSFSIDGTNFTNTNSNIYTFNNLETNRTYEITGRIYNNANLYSEDRISKKISLDLTPKCAANKLGWASEKEVVCVYSYNNLYNYTYSYKIDNGSYINDNIVIEGNLAKVSLTLTSNKTITAKLVDNKNIEHTYTLEVDKIDNTVPSKPILTYDEVDTFKIKTAPTVPSGIAYYEIYASSSNTELTDGEWVRVKFDSASNSKLAYLGKRYSYVRAVSNSGVKGLLSDSMESVLPIKPYLQSKNVNGTTITANYTFNIKKQIRSYTCKIGINQSYSVGSYESNNLSCTFNMDKIGVPLGINTNYSFIICANANDGSIYCSNKEIAKTVDKMYLTDVAYTGAYVSYDAGNWGSGEFSKIPTDATHDQFLRETDVKKLNNNLLFGGNLYGTSSKPKYVESKNESANGLKTVNNGWRILSFNKNTRSASIIHAGSPEWVRYDTEDYYTFKEKYRISFADYLDRYINKNYVNKDYAYEAHNFNEDEFFDVVNELLNSSVNHYMDYNKNKLTTRYTFSKCIENSIYVYFKSIDDKDKVKLSLICGHMNKDTEKEVNSKLSRLSNLLKIGTTSSKYLFNNYSFKSTSTKELAEVYAFNNKLSLSSYTNAAKYGIRPVVDLHKDLYVVGGNGTSGNPYILVSKDYTPSEDTAGKYLKDVASVGDYVIYDAGYWDTTKERPKTDSTGYGNFGGYTINTSRGSSVACRTGEKTLAPKEYNFRVMSVNQDSTLIVHSGVSECYSYNKNYLYGDTLDSIVNNRLNTLYLNDMYADSVRGFNVDDFRKITGNFIGNCTSSTTNCGAGTIIDNGFDVLVLSGSSTSQYRWDGDNSSSGSNTRVYGIKPVVSLLYNVKIVSGSGKKFDPYILKSGKAVTVPDISIDTSNWSDTSHTISILNYDSDKYTYEYGVGSIDKYPTSTIRINSSTFTFNTNGVKYIYVRAKDKEDNYSEWSNYVISNIDKEPPTAPTLSIDSNTWKTDNHVITITGSSTAVSGINYYQYGIGSSSSEPTTWNRIDADPNSNISIDFTTFGEKYVYIRAVSNAGNNGRSSYVISKLDNSKPNATLKNNVLAPNSIVVNYNVNDAESRITKYVCYYKLSSNSTYTSKETNITINPSSSSTTLSCTYSNLDLSTTYNTYMVIYNEAGYETTTTTQTLTTKSGYEGDDLIRVVGMLNSSGNYTLKANGVSYDAEVYYYSGNTTLSGTQCSSGDGKMCIIKVDGNLTTSGTVTTNSNKKGFFIYVTGTLTNSGTISMTGRGSEYSGQNVYLWKNSDGTYEYVPATGAYGSCPGSCQWSNGNKYPRWPGTNGNSGTTSNRKSGGGGSGSVKRTATTTKDTCSNYNTPDSCGGAGSSYAGGSGGAAGHVYSSTTYYSEYSSSQTTYFTKYGGDVSSTSHSNHLLGGGAGVIPGSGYRTGSGISTKYNGGTGAGGLLIIYADTLNNNGSITSYGATGGTGTYTAGGGSGGGSINLFYSTSRTTGSTSASGGSGGSRTASSNTVAAGSGGSGAVTWMRITLD